MKADYISRAEGAITGYIEKNREENPRYLSDESDPQLWEQLLFEILADLHHWADSKELNFEKALRTSREVYQSDKRFEYLGTK